MTHREVTSRLLEWRPTIEEYHGDDAISHSGLEIFRKSPELYAGIQTGVYENPLAEKPSIIESTTKHLMINEPDKFETDVLEIPSNILTVNGAKAGNSWKAFAAAHSDKILVKQTEMVEIRAMQRSVREHPIASKLLAGKSHIEVSLKWWDEEYEIERRARLDRLRDDLIIDVKTPRDVSPESFATDAYRFGYHRQQSFYKDALTAAGLPDLPFVFVCVQKTPPYTTAVYELDEEFVGIGEEQNGADLHRFSLAIRSGIWRTPGWRTIIRLSAPRWARNYSDYDFVDDSTDAIQNRLASESQQEVG